MSLLNTIVEHAAKCGCGGIAHHPAGALVLAFNEPRNVQQFINRAQMCGLGLCEPMPDNANACVLVPNYPPDDPAREASTGLSLRSLVWEEAKTKIYNYQRTSGQRVVEGHDYFEAIATKLFEQGVPSANILGTCKYRGPNGLVCAYGVLIPDDKYDPKMDNGMSIEDIVEEWLPEHAPHIPLFQALQHVHDYNVGEAYRSGDWSKTFWASSETMRAGLRTVSLTFKLHMEELLDDLSFPENRELGGHRNG